jgi:tellurite methyltransferase
MDSQHDDERQHWNKRHAQHRAMKRSPSAFLLKYSHILPRQGRALDVACGTGGNVVLLAKDAGLDVTAVDISDVAIDIATAKARAAGVINRVQLVREDAAMFLERETTGKFVLVTSLNFFEPGLVHDLKRVLEPGGMLVIQAFTTMDERLSASPRMKEKLVSESQLFEPAMLGGYWIMVHEIEDFTDDEGYQRQRVNVIARKP